jgi:acyl carrier protein
MELNEFIKHFAEQFEETEENAFTPDTDFRELDEWSSLISLSIIAMVDEEYNVEINGEDFRQATTISDLYEVVKSKIQ